MYLRFLNNNDYTGLMSQRAQDQMVRDRGDALYNEIEMVAESLIRDYLTEHYDIDYELNLGKYIAGYMPEINITYPSGVHMYIDGDIYQVMEPIRGGKRPLNHDYWEDIDRADIPSYIEVQEYSQMVTYKVGDIVEHNDSYYKAAIPNGLDMFNIRIPDVEGWVVVIPPDWMFDDYKVGDVVRHNGRCWVLRGERHDPTIMPEMSEHWEEVMPYSPDKSYSVYEHAIYESPVIGEVVVMATTYVNQDEVAIGKNVIKHDPRNMTIKNHMVKIAAYEMAKQVSPNNVGVVRMKDYEDTMVWLNRASALRITPDIKRRKDSNGADTVGWVTAKFEKGFGDRPDVIKTGWSAF